MAAHICSISMLGERSRRINLRPSEARVRLCLTKEVEEQPNGSAGRFLTAHQMTRTGCEYSCPQGPERPVWTMGPQTTQCTQWDHIALSVYSRTTECPVWTMGPQSTQCGQWDHRAPSVDDKTTQHPSSDPSFLSFRSLEHAHLAAAYSLGYRSIQEVPMSPRATETCCMGYTCWSWVPLIEERA